MSREPIKTISTKPEKHIPETPGNEGLREDAAKISDRPFYVWARRLGREDRYNIQGLMKTEAGKGADGEDAIRIQNMGAVAKYIWDNCITEACNVLVDEEEHESLKGAEKNRLWHTEGIDAEIMSSVEFVDRISKLGPAEAKN